LGGLLDDVAFNLKNGEVSEAFPYMGRWGLAQALDRRPPVQLTLEEATPDIVRLLEPQERQRAYEEWIRSLREKYHVVVYPERLP
ncbi:MAG: hypothetical protein ABIG68_05185, partial [Acidobacteriota bacterium]